MRNHYDFSKGERGKYVNDNAYTGRRDLINAPINQEDPRLYEIAKQITFEAGFETWTDPRNGKTYHNPNKERRKNDKGKS